MNILIVDDEPLARARLVELIHSLAWGYRVSDAADGSQALSTIEQASPDIVLLDIRMPGLDGLNLAKIIQTLSTPPIVIFTTAYDNHALQAYDVQAIDYLLKPIRRDRLASALARAKQIASTRRAPVKHQSQQTASKRTRISAIYQGTLQVVPVSQIRYFHAEHKYVTARHPEGVILLEESLAALAEEFQEHFLRVHRSSLVAVSHIAAIERAADGRRYIRLSKIDEHISVSRRLHATLRKRLRQLHTANGSALLPEQN